MESIRDYKEMRKRHRKMRCPDLSIVKKAVGKKRFKALNLESLVNMKDDNWKLLEEIIQKTNGAVKGRQNEILQMAYTQLLYTIGKEN